MKNACSQDACCENIYSYLIDINGIMNPSPNKKPSTAWRDVCADYAGRKIWGQVQLPQTSTEFHRLHGEGMNAWKVIRMDNGKPKLISDFSYIFLEILVYPTILEGEFRLIMFCIMSLNKNNREIL